MINVIAYLAGVLAMITFLPQVLKTMRTKKANDISLAMLLLTFATNALYIIYGILLNLYPIIIMLGIMSCIIIVQIILTLKYSTNQIKV